MGKVSMRVSVKGLPALLKKLERLDQKVCQKATHDCVNESTKIVTKATRDEVGSQQLIITKQLWRSIGRKVKRYRKYVTVGVIGPRISPSFAIMLPPKQFGNWSNKPKLHNPAKIGHLVEFGHGGPYPAPPYPYMRPAWASSEAKCLRVSTRIVSVALR